MCISYLCYFTHTLAGFVLTYSFFSIWMFLVYIAVVVLYKFSNGFYTFLFLLFLLPLWCHCVVVLMFSAVLWCFVKLLYSNKLIFTSQLPSFYRYSSSYDWIWCHCFVALMFSVVVWCFVKLLYSNKLIFTSQLPGLYLYSSSSLPFYSSS